MKPIKPIRNNTADKTVDEDLLVSRALKLGLLTEDEIGEDLNEQLGPMIGFWQECIFLE